jgi:succinate dehydrogenase/fumarate reductase cytochrome b subunit
MLDFIIQKAYAQAVANPSGSNSNITFNKLFQNILNQVVTPIIYLLFAAAVVYFLYGVFVFIQNADNQEKRKDGQMHILWGIVGIFIMVSAKGIINLILATI